MIIFLVPINIPELAASDFFKLCLANRGRCNQIAQSWNFDPKFFVDIDFMSKIGSRGQ